MFSYYIKMSLTSANKDDRIKMMNTLEDIYKTKDKNVKYYTKEDADEYHDKIKNIHNKHKKAAKIFMGSTFDNQNKSNYTHYDEQYEKIINEYNKYKTKENNSQQKNVTVKKNDCDLNSLKNYLKNNADVCYEFAKDISTYDDNMIGLMVDYEKYPEDPNKELQAKKEAVCKFGSDYMKKEEYCNSYQRKIDKHKKAAEDAANNDDDDDDEFTLGGKKSRKARKVVKRKTRKSIRRKKRKSRKTKKNRRR